LCVGFLLTGCFKKQAVNGPTTQSAVAQVASERGEPLIVSELNSVSFDPYQITDVNFGWLTRAKAINTKEVQKLTFDLSNDKDELSGTTTCEVSGVAIGYPQEGVPTPLNIDSISCSLGVEGKFISYKLKAEETGMAGTLKGIDSNSIVISSQATEEDKKGLSYTFNRKNTDIAKANLLGSLKYTPEADLDKITSFGLASVVGSLWIIRQRIPSR